jgi:hypothetical protein
MPRKLWEIAQEIAAGPLGQVWIFSETGFHARPYWSAMQDLETIDDTYICDSAKSIVLYFLSNASTWRGETARRIKAELREMVK